MDVCDIKQNNENVRDFCIANKEKYGPLSDLALSSIQVVVGSTDAERSYATHTRMEHDKQSSTMSDTTKQIREYFMWNNELITKLYASINVSNE